jgi:superfamily I DNA/RNA helicase
MQDVHGDYKSFLKYSNAIDYDGQLSSGFQLLSELEELRRQCQHILVDEL